MKRIFIFLAFLAVDVNAGIYYSGQLNLEGPEFSIDLNRDGLVDIETKWRVWAMGPLYSTLGYDTIINFNIRFLNTPLSGFPYFPGTKDTLDSGVLVSAIAPFDLMWTYSSNDAMMWTTHDQFTTRYSGLWHNIDNKFMGLELQVDEDYHYGWVRFDTDSENNITLIDYAFEKEAGVGILTGAIPEPSTFLLIILGSVWLMHRAALKRQDMI
jgi:hypothetical protein